MRRRMPWIIGALVLTGAGYGVWNFTARAAYETPEYTVVRRDGSIEIRDYPEIVVATTSMRLESQGDGGSFRRLLGYISGKNEAGRKLAMTVPVFMEPDKAGGGEMGFVVPSQNVTSGVPQPTSNGVTIKTRPSGRFAVVRFSGRISEELTAKKEGELRAWMAENELPGDASPDVAGYDPPWLPGPLRRNEVLIRLAGGKDDK